MKTRQQILLGAGVLLLLLLSPLPARSTAYNFSYFYGPDNQGTHTDWYAINDAGQVVGQDLGGIGFLKTGDAYTRLSDDPYPHLPYGINNSGQITGYYSDLTIHTNVPFIRDSDGTYSTFIVPNIVTDQTSWAQAYGISNSGLIVGIRDVNQAFVRQTDGTYTFFQYPAGAVGMSPMGINNAGKIVGTTLPHEGSTFGFLKDGNAYIDLNYPGANATYANGINDLGQVVGYYLTGSNVSHGFIWDNGVFTTIDNPDAANTYLYGINNSGQVVGAALMGEDGYGFVGTPVPLPSTMLLLGTGLLGLAGLGRRRRSG